MRHQEPDPSRRAWAPLLVLGGSVMTAVTLIGACMAMLPPETGPAVRGASAQRAAAQLPPSASRNTRVRSASAG